jgi:hypothetical protein
MSQDQGKPLRLFVDPFAAWRELAFKTAEMIAASAHAGAASASRVRVAVIDERPSAPPAVQPRKMAPARASPRKAAAKKRHKKRAKRR